MQDNSVICCSLKKQPSVPMLERKQSMLGLLRNENISGLCGIFPRVLSPIAYGFGQGMTTNTSLCLSSYLEIRGNNSSYFKEFL